MFFVGNVYPAPTPSCSISHRRRKWEYREASTVMIAELPYTEGRIRPGEETFPVPAKYNQYIHHGSTNIVHLTRNRGKHSQEENLG